MTRFEEFQRQQRTEETQRDLMRGNTFNKTFGTFKPEKNNSYDNYSFKRRDSRTADVSKRPPSNVENNGYIYHGEDEIARIRPENSSSSNSETSYEKHKDIEKQNNESRTVGLESDAKRKRRINSLRILNLVGFTFSLSFSIILTGAFPYLKELMPEETENSILFKYGIVVATLPIAQLIFAPIFGMIADRLHSIRPMCVIMSIIFTGASVLYATLSDVSSEPNTRFYLMILSRFCAGAFSSNLGPIRGYISQATLESERTRELAIQSAVGGLGFTLGPVFQALFGSLGCSTMASTNSRYFSFESYNVCGWVTALMGVVNFVLFMPHIFKEQKEGKVKTGSTPTNALEEIQEIERTEEVATEAIGRTGEIATEHNIVRDNINQEALLKALARPDYLGLFVCMVCLSISYFNFVFLESIGSPICMEQFGWTQEQTVTYYGALLGANGILSMGYYASIGCLSKWIDDRKLLIGVGIVAQIIGRITFLPIPYAPLPPLIPKHSKAMTQIPDGYYLLDEKASQKLIPFSNTINMDKFTIPSTYIKTNKTDGSQFGNDAHLKFGRPLHQIYFTNILGNVPCEKVSGPPGCNLEWCSYTPALSVAQFIVGFSITTIGFAFSVPTTLTIASKIYGPRRQGLLMSITVVSGSFSRCLGPFFVSFVYTNYGPYYANGSTVIVLILALGLLCLFYRRLAPLSAQSNLTTQQST